MSSLSTVQARQHFSELVNRTAYGKERVVLTRRGKGIAAVIPLEDFELLQALEDARDLRDAKAALKEARKKGTTSLEDLKGELE